MKTALITGISGQDGSYLAEYLLSLGYRVYGLVRRDADTMRWIRPIADRVELLYGDLRDAESLAVAFHKAWPDELYNLAAQVFVPTSWVHPAETFDINVGGLARLLQIVEQNKRNTLVYQASSSEMYGNLDGACDESTLFFPTSPYGTSKMAAHRLIDVYRKRGIFAVGGILFNHESPRRGSEMVTRKITLASRAWSRGDNRKVLLGNLDAKRDWGFAGDYVCAMHLMLQQGSPKDYVIGTGKSHSVSQFVEQTLSELGLSGLHNYVEVDPKLLRTGEIHELLANPEAAKKDLGWEPKVDFKGLVKMMVEADTCLGETGK